MRNFQFRMIHLSPEGTNYNPGTKCFGQPETIRILSYHLL